MLEDIGDLFQKKQNKPKITKKEGEIEQMRDIIERQENVINDMRMYQLELQEIIKGFSLKIEHLYDNPKKSDRAYEIDEYSLGLIPEISIEKLHENIIKSLR